MMKPQPRVRCVQTFVTWRHHESTQERCTVLKGTGGKLLGATGLSDGTGLIELRVCWELAVILPVGKTDGLVVEGLILSSPRNTVEMADDPLKGSKGEWNTEPGRSM